MTKFRQELSARKYGLTDRARADGEALRTASNNLNDARSAEEWALNFEDFLHAYAIFRYGRREEKAHAKLIEKGLIADPNE